MGYVLMPVKNNVEKTLIATRSFAASGAQARLAIIIDNDEAIHKALGLAQVNEIILMNSGTLGFWNSLNAGLRSLNVPMDEPFVYVGNDVRFYPGWWGNARIKLGQFSRGLGIVSFNDGIHNGFNASHGMLTRRFLEVLNGEPLFYDKYFHYYHDSEMTNRARDLNCYVYAEDSLVLHEHDDSIKYDSDTKDKAIKDRRDVEWINRERSLAKRRLQDAINR